MIPIVDVPDDLGLAIYELVGKNPERLEAMLGLYGELLPRYQNYIPKMRQRAQLPIDHDPHFLEHFWLVEVNSEAVAMTAFKYVPGRDCGLGFDLAVKPVYRDFKVGQYGRLPQFVNSLSLTQLQADAQASGRPVPLGLFVEVGIPKLVERYKEYGFIELPIEYYEPAFPPEIKAHLGPVNLDELSFTPMQVGIFPIREGRFDPSNPSTLTNLIFASLVDHYGLPEGHWVVRRALESLQTHR